MNDGSERNVHTRQGVLMTRNRVLGHKKKQSREVHVVFCRIQRLTSAHIAMGDKMSVIDRDRVGLCWDLWCHFNQSRPTLICFTYQGSKECFT